ncbi:MAG: hemerythrin domain-containing protein [Nakamurella sp.]
MSPATTVEQLNLPGQAAAPAWPVDLAGMYLMHHGFRRDLNNFVRIVAVADLDDRARWRALARRWRLFSVVLHKHHTGEDVGLWPLLLARVDAAGDIAARVTLDAMEAEHADIDPLLASCGQGFDRLAGQPDADARRALEVRLVAARQSLGEHLAHEETDAMALVQRYLTEQDWKMLERDVFAAGYSARESLSATCWVLHELPEPARQAFFRQPGVGLLRLPWRWILRPRFERAERRAFG